MNRRKCKRFDDHKYNCYGIVSGGYLFSQLDKESQFYVAMDKRYRYWLTKSCKIKFVRQCCSNVKIGYGFYKRRCIGGYKVYASAFEVNGTRHIGNVLARAVFKFVGKNDLHCKARKFW